MEQGISPMVIYNEQKIVGYNIATPRQPVEGSYYLIEELFNNGYHQLRTSGLSGIWYSN